MTKIASFPLIQKNQRYIQESPSLTEDREREGVWVDGELKDEMTMKWWVETKKQKIHTTTENMREEVVAYYTERK